MATLAELVVKVGADTKQFTKGMTDAAGKTKAFGQEAKAALGAIGVAAGAYLASAVKSASEAEKVNANLAQTVKSTGMAAGMTAEQLGKLAGQLSKTTTFSAGTIKAGEAMLLTFTNIGKDVFPQATAALLDLSQKMGTEPQQAAIQLGKALNDPVKGITALTRVGVSFTQQQKDQIKEMVKMGDTAGAQKLILAELNKEFGGQAAAAADTYAGKMQVMTNQMNSMKSAIGTALLPALTSLAEKVTAIVIPIADWAKEHPKLTAGILGTVAVIGTLVGGMSLLSMIGGIVPMIAGLGAAIGALSAPILITIAAIAALVAGIVYMWNTNEEFRTAVQAIWADIQQIFSTASEATKGIWAEHGTAIKAIAGGAWNEIKLIIETVLNTIVNLIGLFINLITGDWEGAWINIKAISKAQLDLIKGTFTIAFDALNKLTDGKIGAMVFTAEQGFTNFKNTVLRIWNDITSGIKGFVNQIISGINTVGAGVGTISSYIPGMAGVNIAPIPQLASGGIVTRPTVAMIGEAGPEAVIPLNRANGAGGGNNFYFNITGANARDIWDELQPKIERSLALAGV